MQDSSPRRRVLRSVLWVAAAGLALPGGIAQAAFPDKPIAIIVPTPAGGPVDRVARAYATELQQVLGQPTVVDNRLGAAGKIGVQAALRAPRDGYTLIAVSPSIVTVNPVLDKDPGFDPQKDLTPIGIGAHSAGIVAARAGLPVSSMAELVAYARARPDQLTYASFGIGTSLHLHSEELSQALGIRLRHIPYKGESQAMNALVAGEVDLMLYVTSGAVQFVKNGRLKALAATAGERWAELPDVPSFAESGVPELKNYSYHSWVGFVAPKGLPDDVLQKLRQGFAAVLAKPEFRRSLGLQGFESGDISPASMQQTIERELTRNRRLIDSGRVRLE
jgi:tripartite-type tricarboxylate transporter receptor subunit TctC